VVAGRDRTCAERAVRRSSRLAAAGVSLGAAYVLERALVKRWQVGPEEVAGAGLSMPAEVDHHFVPTGDGARLHVVEAGSGQPIVLIHGVTLGVGVWVRQFRALAGTHRVLAFDLRGHGQSIGGTAGYSFERMADDLLSVLEERQVTGAVVVGHSMGGMVLQLAALRRADALKGRVAGIVLVATDAGPAIAGPFGRPIGMAAAAVGARAARFAERRGRSVFRRSDLATWGARLSFGARPVPADVELVRSISAGVAPRAMAGLLGPLLSFDVRADLGRIDLPTMVVVGSRDVITPAHRARQIAERIPGARLEVLPGSGHLVMLERADALNRLVTGFADELAG
jgi:pimeloyl-ACP methyl ester carboxylesterase